MLVVDASVAVAASAASDGFGRLPDRQLAAPPLMWSEGRAVLRLSVWSGRLERHEATSGLERLEDAPVERVDPPELGRTAWRIAEGMGWARTYDAEYLALASLLGCRLVTLDARLRRGAARLGYVVSPSEL